MSNPLTPREIEILCIMAGCTVEEDGDDGRCPFVGYLRCGKPVVRARSKQGAYFSLAECVVGSRSTIRLRSFYDGMLLANEVLGYG